MFKKFSHRVKIQSKHRSSFYFFLIILFIYLFLAVLGLLCYVSCSLVAVQGLLTLVASVTEHMLRALRVSSCGSQALEHRLSSCGTQASFVSRHVGSSQTRDRTCASCLGRWTPQLSHQGSPRSSFPFSLLLKKSAGNKAGSKKDMGTNILYISV